MLLLIIVCIVLVINIRHNTIYKYDDAIVIGSKEQEIIDVYGNFHNSHNIIHDWNGHTITKTAFYVSYMAKDIFGNYDYTLYYVIYFDENGIAVYTKYQKAA